MSAHDTTGDLFHEFESYFAAPNRTKSLSDITTDIANILSNYNNSILHQFDLVTWSADLISKFNDPEYTLHMIEAVVTETRKITNLNYSYADLADACIKNVPDISYKIIKQPTRYSISDDRKAGVINRAKLRYHDQMRRETDAPASLLSILFEFDPASLQ